MHRQAANQTLSVLMQRIVDHQDYIVMTEAYVSYKHALNVSISTGKQGRRPELSSQSRRSYRDPSGRIEHIGPISSDTARCGWYRSDSIAPIVPKPATILRVRSWSQKHRVSHSFAQLQDSHSCTGTCTIQEFLNHSASSQAGHMQLRRLIWQSCKKHRQVMAHCFLVYRRPILCTTIAVRHRAQKLGPE